MSSQLSPPSSERKSPPSVVLEEGVDAVRVRARHGHPDAPDDALGRHAGVARDLGPAVAPVGRLEHAAAGAAGRHGVLLAEGLPQRRVEHVRVVPVDHDVDRAGALVAEENALPAVAAIGRTEDAPLLARHPVLPERRDVDNGRIGRVDADLGDAVRVAEPDVLPGGARVAAAVDAVAGQDVAANAGLAGADEDEIGVGFGDRDGADRGRRDLEVGDGEPVFAAVGSLPEAAAGGAEVGFLGAAGHAADGDGAAAAVWAEIAPCVAGEEGGVEGGLLGGEGGGCGREEGGGEEEGGNWGASHGGLPVGAGTGGASGSGGLLGRVKLPGGWRLGQAAGGASSVGCAVRAERTSPDDDSASAADLGTTSAPRWGTPPVISLRRDLQEKSR